MVLQGHVTNENHYISTIRVPMATKLKRIITYMNGLLHINSHDPFALQGHEENLNHQWVGWFLP